jgi:hypothetical protein
MTVLNAFRCALVLLGVLLTITSLTVSYAKDSAADMVPSATHYRIDTDRSWLRVLVYKGGLLSALGHNHVVSHNDISGAIAVLEEPRRADIALELEVARFVVDDAQLRVAEGTDFSAQVSTNDIAATKSNMLGEKLLAADRFPTIRIQSTAILEALPNIELKAIVTMLGREFPLMVSTTAVLEENSFVAIGESTISHVDIGLSPFKAAFGALRVKDSMVLKFELHGARTAIDFSDG